MSESVRLGAYPDKTPDGKDVVYVAAPSPEGTEQWAEAEANALAQRAKDTAHSARIQALGLALQVRNYGDNDPEAVIATARKFHDFITEGTN